MNNPGNQEQSPREYNPLIKQQMDGLIDAENELAPTPIDATFIQEGFRRVVDIPIGERGLSLNGLHFLFLEGSARRRSETALAEYLATNSNAINTDPTLASRKEQECREAEILKIRGVTQEVLEAGSLDVRLKEALMFYLQTEGQGKQTF